VSIKAGDHHDKKYYDKDGRDHHTWDAQGGVPILGNNTAIIVHSTRRKLRTGGTTSNGITTNSNDLLLKVEVR
jgi:hypothetical protein